MVSQGPAAVPHGTHPAARPAAVIAAALLVTGMAPLPTTTPATVVAPAAASQTAGGPQAALAAASPAADPTPVAGLQPPPLRAAAPSGTRPGPTAGLRSPDRCAPPPADTTPTSAASGAERLQLAAAHRLATGAGQVVAVIDTGVSPHPRLGNRLRGGGDYLTGGSGLADCDGHGTAVAGIIGASAVGRGDGGVEGIAPAAQVLAIRQSSPSFEVTGPDGTPRAAGDVRTLAAAIVLAVRSGATVINVSEAVCLRARQAATQGAQVQAALRLAARSDVVVVAAAGNVGVGSCAPAGQEPADQVAIPGWYGDDILTVGAVGPDDAPAAFTVPGPWVDVAAPGSGLRSLAVGGGTTADDLDGTSFAAPWVAGLAALLKERFPQLTAAQVVDRILATARRPAGGRSALQVGRGVVDPMAALTAVPDVLPPGPARAASAPLAGTAARPEILPPDSPFVPLTGAAVLVGCLAAAASRLRRPPLV